MHRLGEKSKWHERDGFVKLRVFLVNVFPSGGQDLIWIIHEGRWATPWGFLTPDTPKILIRKRGQRFIVQSITHLLPAGGKPTNKYPRSTNRSGFVRKWHPCAVCLMLPPKIPKKKNSLRCKWRARLPLRRSSGGTPRCGTPTTNWPWSLSAPCFFVHTTTPSPPPVR